MIHRKGKGNRLTSWRRLQKRTTVHCWLWVYGVGKSLVDEMRWAGMRACMRLLRDWIIYSIEITLDRRCYVCVCRVYVSLYLSMCGFFVESKLSPNGDHMIPRLVGKRFFRL